MCLVGPDSQAWLSMVKPICITGWTKVRQIWKKSGDHIERKCMYPKHESNACQVFQPILSQCSLFIPPENTRKSKLFWCFQVVENGNIGQKWVNIGSCAKEKSNFSLWCFDVIKFAKPITHSMNHSKHLIRNFILGQELVALLILGRWTLLSWQKLKAVTQSKFTVNLYSKKKLHILQKNVFDWDHFLWKTSPS